MQDGTTHPGDLGAAAVAAGRVSPAPANAWTPALVAAAGEGASWWMVGDRVTLRVPASATGGVFSLLEIFVVPGGGGPPHIHGRESETFHVVEGEVTMLAGGETLLARAGTTVHIPAGTVHYFANRGTAPARMLLVIAPAGFEGFFAEGGAPGRADDPTPPPADEARLARLVALAPKYHLSFVVPLPGHP